MNDSPIGVFDSGLGGLTAVKELRAILPGEDIVYFGDTGRVPYGSRGRDTIIAYAKQDIAFLLSKNVKTILAACGTVSSTLPPEEGARLPVGYDGVVTAAAVAAVNATKNNQIGVIGTEATIRSGSYQKALRDLSSDIHSVARACPLFVPLVENGRFRPDDRLAALVTEEYLEDVKKAGVDTVVLGCTHYPLLTDVVQRQMGDKVTLIDPGKEAALCLRATLEAKEMLSGRDAGGKVWYYVSDDPSRFDHLARLFLGVEEVEGARRVNIENYSLKL